MAAPFVETKVSISLVDDLVRSRCNIHKSYSNEMTETLRVAAEVAKSIIESEDGLDMDALNEVKKFAGECVDFRQQFVDQTTAFKQMRDRLQNKSAAEIGNESLASNLHGEIHLVATVASREPNVAQATQQWMDEVVRMSERGAQRFRGGWKLDGNAALVNEPGDADVEIAGVGTQVTTKCPITQQILVHPVRSSRCKHVYERDAITDLLRKHKGKNELRCPVSGCSERVGRDELERSRSTEAAVKRATRRAGSQRATVDEDEDLDLT